MSENASEHYGHADDEPFDDVDGYEIDDYETDGYADDYGTSDYAVDDADAYDEPAPAHRPGPERVSGERAGRPYRPGRGGFDPEAAEMAARAKYTYRQRVVVGLLATAVITAIVAAVVLPVLWWLHAIVDVTLIGYLVYLRRQVRIEDEIRERRAARLGRSRAPEVRGASELPRRDEEQADGPYADYDDAYVEAPGDPAERALHPMPSPQRKPIPEPIQHNGVYVDPADEDPAFHELDQPGEQPFRKAVGQ